MNSAYFNKWLRNQAGFERTGRTVSWTSYLNRFLVAGDEKDLLVYKFFSMSKIESSSSRNSRIWLFFDATSLLHLASLIVPCSCSLGLVDLRILSNSASLSIWRSCIVDSFISRFLNCCTSGGWEFLSSAKLFSSNLIWFWRTSTFSCKATNDILKVCLIFCAEKYDFWMKNYVLDCKLH